MYPIGIPAVYATILWKNRELLNPRIHVTNTTRADRETTGTDPANGDDVLSTVPPTKAQGTSADCFSSLELQELSERVKARRVHPELVPSMFLWKDFGESCKSMRYLEALEAGISCCQPLFQFSFNSIIPFRTATRGPREESFSRTSCQSQIHYL